ncbi:unnamed protein product [Caenorhabditis sp. 36 PRJEB53466]|nr:unnamed protein product [Caenorhabditis sp. 36 PRJEB53466]
MAIIPREQQLAEYLLNMPMCIFCSSFHRSETCDRLTDTVSRILHLLHRGLCLVCISHHVSLPCPRSRIICAMCNHMSHHVSICYQNDMPRDDIVDIYEDELEDDYEK